MLLVATTVTASTLAVAPVHYEAPKPKTISELIHDNAVKYGVSEWLMTEIIRNESRNKPTAKGDADYVCKRTGQISPSYGLVQISSCWHPEVTYEQATNPAFAIEFLAKGIAAGKCRSEWTTCRALIQ